MPKPSNEYKVIMKNTNAALFFFFQKLIAIPKAVCNTPC